LYGSQWRELSGFEGEPERLQPGTVVGRNAALLQYLVSEFGSGMDQHEENVIESVQESPLSQGNESIVMCTVKRQRLETIGNIAGIATIVFVAVRLPKVALLTGWGGRIISGMLAADDFSRGNKVEGAIGVGAVVVGVRANRATKRGVQNTITSGVRITVGKTGRYYSKGRVGAMNTQEAIQRKIDSDLASGVYGRIAPEVTELIINAAGEALSSVFGNEEE
jgi:hypothetical protein